ncbi:MAG TPA: tRNA (5-methylaminomethyl-2-thiouridine)(34)-methyltransferase MnmD [Chitinophagaceae bacterium]|jgi:tRNA U34 5-methylaminomethyl-2-thiouridine-forming methyltransferase MnmC
MNREIIVTADGSHSIRLPELNQSYHSMHGALQESVHVYMEAGLRYAMTATGGTGPLYVFEMGFGTGLNALLTAMEAERQQRLVHYETIDAFPLDASDSAELNFCQQLQRTDLNPLFEYLHYGQWDIESPVTPYFSFQKHRLSLAGWLENKRLAPGSPGIDVVYFDAFAPEVQPELWTAEVFTALYTLMAPGGILVTYCSKTVVRRAVEAAGFRVYKIPGPRGKREMLRAIKSPAV